MRYLFPVCFLLSLCGLAFASAGTPTDALPVDHGMHARDGNPCADAPFGALRMVDGRGLSSAEYNRGTTTIVAYDGPVDDLSTTCDTFGDGAPARVKIERQGVEIRSRIAWRFARSDAGALHRLCRAS